jgi:hypothetical protein
MMELKPIYDFKNPNESISLASDVPCSFRADQEELKGIAEVKLVLLPRPGIDICVQCDFDSFMHFNSILSETRSISLNGHDIPVFATSVSTPTSGKTKITFTPYETPIPWIGDENTKLSKVVFHLFNFENTIGTSHLAITTDTGGYIKEITELKSKKWVVEIHNHETSKVKKKLKETGGYGLTHVACLSRSDGVSFEAKEAELLIGDLYLFFTFSLGAFCSPVLPVGFDENEEVVWAQFNDPHRSGESQFSWFDPHHCEELAELFPNFLSILENEKWKDTLHTVIYWYARSNNISGSGVDTGIVLTQIAIERLSFEYAVNQKKLIEADGFKKLNASDKFRILFSSLDLPLEIPENFTEVKTVAKRHKYIDSPHVLTTVRNSMVHSEHKKNENFSDIYYEIWLLGLWYLELSILKLCNYQGTYANRLVKERWVGTVENVPWNKKTLEKNE